MTKRIRTTAKRLSITIVNLAELVGREFRPQQTAAINLSVVSQGITKFEVSAKWNRSVFQLLGDSKRKFCVDRGSPTRQKSIWQFRICEREGDDVSRIEFTVRGGQLVQAAVVPVRTKGN